MASGDIEKSFCRVCKTVFTFKGPEPYLLPCLHPACKPCVDSDHETITCNTCQQLFWKVNSTFPKDFLLNNAIFQTALKHTPFDIICTNRNDGAKANTWCPKCEAFLCITCQEFHKETKATRSHVVESLQSYLEPDNNCCKTLGFCKIHQDHPLGIFDSSCGRLVCYKCLKVDNSTCSVEDIDEAFEKMIESDLDNSIEQIVSKLDVITEMQQQAQDLAKKLVENSKRVRDEVINTFSEIRGTLDMREKMLLEETSQSFHEVQNTNRERMEVLKQEKTRCEGALLFIKRSKGISDPVQALTMKRTIDDRTATCIEANLPDMDGRESSISLSTQDLMDVKQSIETFAGLYSVVDQGTLVKAFSGPTTQEKLNQKLLQLENKVNSYRQTLETIPLFIERRHKTGKIEMKIPGISSITTECHIFSENKCLNNMEWYLTALFTKQNDELMFGLFLCGLPPKSEVIEFGKKWTCEVQAHIEITNHAFERFSKRQVLKAEFSDENYFGGYGSLIPKKTLQDPKTGFAMDDCIKVNVEVEILGTTGFLSLREMITKNCLETLDKDF